MHSKGCNAVVERVYHHHLSNGKQHQKQNFIVTLSVWCEICSYVPHHFRRCGLLLSSPMLLLWQLRKASNKAFWLETNWSDREERHGVWVERNNLGFTYRRRLKWWISFWISSETWPYGSLNPGSLTTKSLCWHFFTNLQYTNAVRNFLPAMKLYQCVVEKWVLIGFVLLGSPRKSWKS